MTRTRPLLRAVALTLAAACPALGPVAPPEAAASVSIAVTWEGLIRESTAAAVVTPDDGLSVWEGGRIYTYTRVHVEQGVAGDVPSGEAWVRTMGGVVGKVGQLVEGEAVLEPGQRTLLFLKAGPPGAYVVTARGQGQFPITGAGAGTIARVSRSHAVGMLLPPRSSPGSATRLAADVLDGRPVDDVARDILAAWSALHAK